MHLFSCSTDEQGHMHQPEVPVNTKGRERAWMDLQKNDVVIPDHISAWLMT